VLIEQAIFTSARTAHGSGYHLVAKSAGITPEEAAELAVWGPSHGSLRDEREDASSVNFHRLSQGQLCVSKSIAAGEEYSERGGARIYTHFLIVPAEIFARFANQPFAVLRAAWAKGLLDVPAKPPTTLQPFKLAGRSARVDEGLLAQLAEEFGPQRTGQLIAAAVTPGIKLLAGISQSETVFAGLLNFLPVECRSDVSFTTGLRFSPRRPFELLPLEENPDEQRRAIRQEGVTLVDLSTSAIVETQQHGWSKYVAELIEADRLTTLVSQLQLQRPSLTVEHMDELGEQLLREFRRSPKVAKTGATGSPQKERSGLLTGVSRPSKDPLERSGAPALTESRAVSATGTKISPPTLIDLGATKDPVAIDLVEQLDDAIYDAINGRPEARELAHSLWAQLSARLPEPTAAKLREQYLRYTLSLWEACLDNGMREPEKAAGALDVLSLLFDGE
jgi:hypothetical protein